MIKGSIQEEDITCQYISNQNRGTKYIKQILTDIKEETDKNKIIVEDVNSLLTSIGSSSRQKINMAALVHNKPNGFIDI